MLSIFLVCNPETIAWNCEIFTDNLRPWSREGLLHRIAIRARVFPRLLDSHSFPYRHNGTKKFATFLLEFSSGHVWWEVSEHIMLFFLCLSSKNCNFSIEMEDWCLLPTWRLFSVYRIGEMSRDAFDAYGLESSKQLSDLLARVKAKK